MDSEVDVAEAEEWEAPEVIGVDEEVEVVEEDREMIGVAAEVVIAVGLEEEVVAAAEEALEVLAVAVE
jgi:hypothetical protein